MALGARFVGEFLAELAGVDVLMAADAKFPFGIFKLEFLLALHHMAAITRSLCMFSGKGEAGCVVVKTFFAFTCTSKFVPVISYVTSRAFLCQ